MAPKKNQKMSLGTFLQDENYGSWADEMEDMPLPTSDTRPSYGSERRAFSTTTGMGNGYPDRRDTYPAREQLPLPTQPPFTAHLANLSFDATQGDINDFFRDCQVTNVRIVEDKQDRKPKGFGYVEFATLDGLKAALALSGSNLAGRQVRVSVAEPPKERHETRDFSDWSRKGPLPDLPNQRRVSDRPGGYGGRSFDNMSDAGSERGHGNERGHRRGFGPEGDGKVRDFSNWERKGPLSPVTPGPTTLREGGRQGSKEGYSFRKNSPSWGEARSQDGSRPPRREYAERPPPERQPTAPELDNQWRSRMKPDSAKAPTPEASEPSSPARQLALRQKKEAEEKVKAEKAEEKRLAKEKSELDKERVKDVPSKESKEPKEAKDSSPAKENGEDNAQPTPKFDILRRADSGMNDMVADDENDAEGEEQPQPTDDKAVKPKEIVQTPTSAKTNGSWRNGPAAQPPAASTATELEEDGWSTVSKPQKQRNNRRYGPSRGAAS
ncbi:RNA recognition motif aka RRM, RBD, or RNP domain-containing protein isoform 5 [Cladophialophora immunda]|nr:RNA recognition motif aka RRM, RBD, or RNP domain-containing protein isoform 5 [Cladophialophora immunda]